MSRRKDIFDMAGDELGQAMGFAVPILGLLAGLGIAARERKKRAVQYPDALEPEAAAEAAARRAADGKQGLEGFVSTVKRWKVLQPERRQLLLWVGASYALFWLIIAIGMGDRAGGALFSGLCLAPFALVGLEVILAAITTQRDASVAQEPVDPQPDRPPGGPPLDRAAARVYTIALPRDTVWEPEVARSFMAQILHKLGRLTFRIVAEEGRISWQILDLRLGLEPGVIEQAVYASYPEAEVTVSYLETPSVKAPFYRALLRYRNANDFVCPMRYVTDLKEVDPLAALTQEMGALRAGERIAYTLVVTSHAAFAYEEGEKLVTTSAFHPLQFTSAAGMGQAAAKLIRKETRKERYVDSDQKVLREKLNQTLYQALLLVEVTAPTPERVVELAAMKSHLAQFARPPYNSLEMHMHDDLSKEILRIDSDERAWRLSALGVLERWLTNAHLGWQDLRLILEPRELASLWHLPHEGFSAASVEWAPGRRRPVPAALAANGEGVFIGTNEYAGRRTSVRLRDEDREAHLSVVGITKAGKSTFMHRLIHQDIARGCGVAVIDPHGNLVRDTLRSSIPDERLDDVVVLDLENVAHPPPLNPLAVPAGANRRVAAGRLLAILDKLYGGFSDKPRLADTLTSALMTLWKQDVATVRDVRKLFHDPSYRYELLQQLDDAVAEEFWASFEQKSAGMQDQLSFPVIYRMRAFYGHEDLAVITCHPDALGFRQLIAGGKILLVSLKADEARIPSSERQLLGAALISQLQLAGGQTPQAKPPFYIYVDEAQNFVTSALPEMLSGARKSGLYLTLANQYLKQLAGPTLDAVVGTVGTRVAFEVGPDDAQLLAPYLKPEFTTRDLLNLGLHKAVVKTLYQGAKQPAFSLQTPPPLPVPADGEAREAHIRARSVRNYTPTTRQAVLDWLRRRYPPPSLGRTGSVVGDGGLPPASGLEDE